MTEHVASIDRRGELMKLGRLLDTHPEVLSHLVALEGDALRAVREALSASLFDASRPMLQRVARASKLLPNGTTARVGEHVFGPMLCARIVGLLAPEHALDLALRMPDEFLADTSVQLDPRQAHPLVAALPTGRIVAVAGVLVARRDFITIARFVGYVSRETIEAVIASVPDELALLHIASFIESKPRLAQLLDLIPRERLLAMVQAIGAHGGELWLEALNLTTHLDRSWKQTIGDLAAELDASMLEAMVTTARAFAAWDAVLPLVAAMSDHSQRRFVGLAAIHDDAVLTGLLDAADRLGMWRQLLPLAAQMSPPLLRRLALLVADRPGGMTTTRF